MALINCPNCGCKVSDKADACPKCGTPISDCSESLEKEIVPPAISVDNQSEENEEQKFYKSILHLIELENYEDAFVGIDTLLAQSDHPDQYVGLKESVVEKWVKKLTEDADRYISNDMAADANGCIQQALLLKPGDMALLSRLDTIKAINKKSSKPLIIGISLLAIVAVGILIWFIMARQDGDAQGYMADEIEDEMIDETVAEESAEFLGVDLAMFDLKGHVKQVEYPRDNGQPNGPAFVCKFDKDGKMVSGCLLEIFNYHPNAADLQPQRNEEGKIVSFYDSEIHYTITPLFFDNGKIMSLDISLPTMGEESFRYSMDNYGVISSSLFEVSIHGYRCKTFSDYEYTKYDDNGNWIERKASGTKYEYSYDYDREEEVEQKEEFSGDIETRKILYY